MSAHLSNEQISAWMIGERSRQSEEHVHACAACQTELTAFETTLLQFQGTVRQWSDELYDPNLHIRPTPSYKLFPKLFWAVALLAACLSMSFLVQRRAPSPATADALPTDAALMRQLDQEVSRTVPAPMEPLMKLVSWDGKSAAGEPVRTTQ